MHINRRAFMRRVSYGLSASAVPASLFASMGEGTETSRKNVLFIIVEDLKAIMGCYGDPLVQTPHLDRLARKGVVFDRAYCQFPVCNPSRTSFLTGLRPDKTGVLNNVVNRNDTIGERVTMPRFFRDNGYHTVGLGKIFHGHPQHNDPAGWDINLDFKTTETGRKGEGRNLTNGAVKWCHWLAAEGADEDQPDGQLAAKAVEILRGPREKPFFMALGFHKPHDPFHAPKKYYDPYPLSKLMPPAVPESRGPEKSYTIGSGWKAEFDKFTLKEEREFLRSYYACVSFTDAQIGKVLDELDRQGLWENTVVLFVGDHGYNLGEHDWWNKNVLFEESARVPMIAVVEGETKPGTRCDQIVELVDLYPTFADLCGLKTADRMDGSSFRALLGSPDRAGKQAAYTQVKRGQVVGKSVRTRRWRYTEWRNGEAIVGEELYDHGSDPGEYRNLAGVSEYVSVKHAHQQLLRKD